MGKIIHRDSVFSIARRKLLTMCDGDELRFYLYLKLYAINKHNAFPSKKTILDDLGWSEKKMRTVINKAVEAGHLEYLPGVGQYQSLYNISWYDSINENNDFVSEVVETDSRYNEHRELLETMGKKGRGQLGQVPLQGNTATAESAQKGNTVVPKMATPLYNYNNITTSNTASEEDAEQPDNSKSENWKLAEEYIKTNLEKWKGAGYDWPTKEGVYDWRFLLDHGKRLTPEKLIGALYWESKQRNTDDTREFTSKEKAWESFWQERKSAVKLANLFTPEEFREKLEEVAEWASSFKDSFDWKLSTILKRLND